MKKAIIIIIIVLVAVAVTVFAIMYFTRDQYIMDGPGMIDEASCKLVSYSYSSAGGMNGGHYNIDVVLTENGNAEVRYDIAEMYNSPSKKHKFTASPRLLDELYELISENGVETWPELPESEFVLLDAPTSHYYFSFKNGDSIAFDSNKSLPDRAYTVLRQIDALISAYDGAGERRAVLKVPSIEELNEYTPPKNSLSAIVTSFSNRSLGVEIFNTTGEIKEYPGAAFEIYRINGEEKTLAVSASDEYTVRAAPGYTTYHMFKVEKELAAGKYLLVFGDVEAEFEMY